MSAKKLTARKRAELKRKKIKEQKKSNFPIYLILFIIIIVVIIGLYSIFLNNGTDGNNQTSNTAPIATEDYPIAFIDTTMGIIVAELYDDKVPIIDKLAEDLVRYGVVDKL